MKTIGLGCIDFNIAVYIANKPPMLEYTALTAVTPVTKGEIEAINKVCGNGWRKVFNVYAKLLFALGNEHFIYSQLTDNWQNYRDDHLLQSQSKTALLFSPPKTNSDSNVLHIICGKTYAKHLLSTRKVFANLIWLDDEFAIDKELNLIVCPYFDYRQLTNIKIERLAFLLRDLKTQ